ncbi:MAG: hypothetical protein JSV44_10320 [Candidatus Zixiibacteriota bacterium]|nr:MAG: hypothetical protein JSV44_10320 [candidate division Zixibacteria bacterium]
MASQYVFPMARLQTKLILLILSVILVFSLMFCGCPMSFDEIKFIHDGKKTKKLRIKPMDNVTLELTGGTMDYGMPIIPLYFTIRVNYDIAIEPLFFPENLTATINGKDMMCRPDSLNFRYGEGTILYPVNCGYKFNADEIEYIRDIGNTIKISFDDFMVFNNNPVYIDTVVATAPKLKKYYKFRK